MHHTAICPPSPVIALLLFYAHYHDRNDPSEQRGVAKLGGFMRSLISEFSYGFALTHEFVQALGTLSAAPIFPSLVDEGATGGGYDVHLDKPGLPIYIQFKRSECLTLKTGREVKAGSGISTPYYRFAVTASADSEQHKMLLGWDVAPNEVFYAAPMFYTKAAFDEAYKAGEIRQRSFFVRPRVIGRFSDTKAHHVSFDGRKCVVMSEFKEIEALGVAGLERHFRDRLAQEKMPLREALPAIVERARSVRETARRQEAEEAEQATLKGGLEARSAVQGPDLPPIEGIVGGSIPQEAERISGADEFFQVQRAAIPPSPNPQEAGLAVDGAGSKELAELAELADIAIRDLNSQLYIVQDRSA